MCIVQRFTSTFTSPFPRFHNNMASNGEALSGPIFFWREFEHPYGFLSQWYESPFEVDGVTYQTAEMWMMIQKALLFGDEVGLALCHSKSAS